MQQKQPLRILVVDDEAPMRRALGLALRGQGYEVRAEAASSTAAEVAAAFDPHLAVLDVRLPGGPDGYEVARRMRRASEVPILFLTAADSLRERLRGFEAGADDYLVKPFALEEFLARVQALLRRAGRLAMPLRQVGDLVMDEGAHTAVRAGTKLELTRTEYDLLFALVRHTGQVLSKAQLLSIVWGFEACDENLVEVHVSSLRRKLEALGPRLVDTVRGVGYVVRA